MQMRHASLSRKFVPKSSRPRLTAGLNLFPLRPIYGCMANQQKVTLITGANKGLGLEMARQLGGAGVTVIAGARDQEKGETACAKLRASGIDAYFVKLEVTEPTDRALAAD